MAYYEILYRMKVKYILVLAGMTLMLSSCVVSKKKYESLLSAKRSCDRRNRGLTEQVAGLENSVDKKVKQIAILGEKVKGMQEEYNNLKYDMSASNAQKSSQIDKLSEKLNLTIKDKKTIKAEKSELKNDIEWLQKLKELNRVKIDSLQTLTQQLQQKTEMLEEKNKSQNLQEGKMEEQVATLKDKLDIANTRLKRAQTLNAKLQKELVQKSKAKEVKEVIDTTLNKAK